MQPENTETPVQVTILTHDGRGDRPLGSGVLVDPLVVLADETLSRDLHSRTDLFPSTDADVMVLFDRAADGDPQPLLGSAPSAERDSTAPVFFVELVDGERSERVEVCELARSLDAPRPWVGLGLAQRSALPLSELPDAALEGLDEGPLEGRNPLCHLIPKFCR